MRNKITAARRLWLPLILCAALLGVLTLNAAAATAAQLRPDMTIIIDGAEQTFYNAQGQEVHPILCGGTTYLPVRAIGEVMGKNVDWNQTNKTVTLRYAGRRCEGEKYLRGHPHRFYHCGRRNHPGIQGRRREAGLSHAV